MIIIAALVVGFLVGASAVITAAAFLISGRDPIKRREPNPTSEQKEQRNGCNQ